MDDISYDENVDTLFLSDDKVFYTVEGEGRWAGRPSVFMRLAMCNLTCIGFKSPDSPFGCDSYTSWSVKNKLTFKEIYDTYFLKTGYIYNLFENPNCLLKITGGEPFIQQKQLIKFIQFLKNEYFTLTGKVNRLYIDFETNATIKPDKYWELNATFTTSPKLASNGDSEEKRYIPEVLNWHANNYSDFKFVVQNKNDIDEILTKYVNKFNISKKQVFLMPCCGSRKELIENSAQVAEWCKEYGFTFSPRLQLLIWDKALKV